jgi:hypothetical protein
VKIVTLIVVVVIALFFLLPILHGQAQLPENMSPGEIGKFIGGFARYWFEAIKTAFS